MQDIPLGIYRTEIGLELRQAIFLNSVLYNSETWHGLKMTDIAGIKLIDNQLLRYICKAQEKTPLEFLFLETGEKPIDFIISSFPKESILLKSYLCISNLTNRAFVLRNALYSLQSKQKM